MNPLSTLSALALCISLLGTPFAVSGCSSSSSAAAPTYSCSNKGPCLDDPTPTASQAAACQALSDDPTCGAAFVAYSMCGYAVAQCTDAGLSDPTADSVSNACDGDYATYTTCLTNKMNDAGIADTSPTD